MKGSDRGARVNPRHDLYRRGIIALNNKQTEQGIEYLKAAVRYAPIAWNYADYEDCLGRAYLELENYHEAINEFNRVLATSPNYPLAHYFLANAYSALGQQDAARENYRIFLDIWKDADDDLKELQVARNFLRSNA
jgi:tetratricopeptide (TPR) repeat protein